MLRYYVKLNRTFVCLDNEKLAEYNRDTMSTNEQLYTPNQAANILKVNRITIYRMIRDSRLKAITVGARDSPKRPTYRIPASELNKLLEESSGETGTD